MGEKKGTKVSSVDKTRKSSEKVGDKKRQIGVLGLVVLLIAVVVGSVLFVGAVSGWFSDGKVKLDAEYYCGEQCDGEYVDISGEEYEALVNKGKSFVVLVDQGGCTTADRLREYMVDFALKSGFSVYRIMFAEMKETSLHEAVKYYPSVVVVSQGKPVTWLRADSDEDADIYNNYDLFEEWMERHL